MQEENLIHFAIQNSCGPSVPNQSWQRIQKKLMHILQLKYLIRFTQALFKPKGIFSEKLLTLEGIWDIWAL